MAAHVRRSRGRVARLIVLLLLTLGFSVPASADGRFGVGLARPPAPPGPAPGSPWWWDVRLDDLTRAADRAAAARDLAAVRYDQALGRRVAATGRAHRASARHEVAAGSLLRLDERLRALASERAAVAERFNAALAVLAGRARLDGRAGPALARTRLLTAGLIAGSDRQRRHQRELAGSRAARALELRALAAAAEYRQVEARAADSEAGARSAHRLATTLEWMEIDRRWAAVGALTGRIAAHLATLPTAPSPEDHAWLAPHRADPAGYRRAIDLDRRLDHSLLRLAGETIRATRIEIWRAMAPAPAAGPPMARGSSLQSSLAFGPSIRLFPPIAGWPGDPEPSRSGRRERGLVLLSSISQIVSAPLPGRIAFAASFGVLGPLLIIDHGEGYHVLMAGLSQLDVREGTSVVAGQAVGEIVAQGDEPARLRLELRYRGVPLDPAPRLAAREDKVRS